MEDKQPLYIVVKDIAENHVGFNCRIRLRCNGKKKQYMQFLLITLF